MISRYSLFTTAELSNFFEVASGLPKGVKPHYNLSPAVNAPVVLNEADARVIKLMKWGLMAAGSKDTNSIFRYKTYNIESEKIFSRHSWEGAVRERRCLVPANGFYLLKGSGAKQAYYAHAQNDELLSFAGVYSSWEDPDGTVQGTFSIITIEASTDLPSTQLRVPVIISKDDEARWLDTNVSDMGSIYDMLRSHKAGQLDVYEVSTAVYSPKPNTPELIERV